MDPNAKYTQNVHRDVHLHGALKSPKITATNLVLRLPGEKNPPPSGEPGRDESPDDTPLLASALENVKITAEMERALDTIFSCFGERPHYAQD